MKNKLCLILLFVLIFFNVIKAQDYFISVGVKLGYLWGKGDGSFNTGVEASIMFWKNDDKLYPFGFVFDYDIAKHLKSDRIHIGIQKNVSIYGVDIGPTFMFGEENSLGISVIPYAGFLLIPYGEFSFYNGYSVQGVGSYLKFPIKSKAKRFSFGG